VRYIWQLIKWLWATGVKALEGIMITGVVAGVAFVVYRFRDQLRDLWHRIS